MSTCSYEKYSTVAFVALISTTAAYLFFKHTSKSRFNVKIQLDNAKVVDVVKVEDVVKLKEGSVALCRCWKSSNWPYCDGSHAKHNKETGDNLGPVVVSK